MSVTLVLVATLFAAVSASAQRDGVRLRERIQQMKKMKLIETLDMDEQTAEKFFVKYNLAQNAIDDAHRALDRTLDNLEEAIRDNETGRMKELSEQAVKQHSALQEAIAEMFRSVRPVLSEAQYARFILFESRFQEEVRRQLLEMRREREEDGPRRRRPR